jgi:hypothetical protein
LSKKSKREKIRHESLETAPPAKKKPAGKATWKMMDKASTIAAGIIAHRVSSVAWRVATGRKPPTSTRHPELGKTEAVTWAVLAGVAVELSKVLIRRGTATYWVKSTGKLPPGMKPLKTTGKKGEEKPADPPVEESAGKTAKKRRRISSRSRGK